MHHPPDSSSLPTSPSRTDNQDLAAPSAAANPPQLVRPSAFRPVTTRLQSASCSTGGGELTPVTGPIPVHRDDAAAPGVSSGDELPGNGLVQISIFFFTLSSADIC